MIFRRIKDLREDNDLKQENLAQYLNIKQSTYSNYETGKINVTIETFIKLAQYYNTSIDYLTGLTDEHKPYPKSKK
jgi:transcriptional regulator with XRE-family HTH domain